MTKGQYLEGQSFFLTAKARARRSGGTPQAGGMKPGCPKGAKATGPHRRETAERTGVGKVERSMGRGKRNRPACATRRELGVNEEETVAGGLYMIARKKTAESWRDAQDI